MKNLFYLNPAAIIFVITFIFAPCLKSQDTLNFYSDTSVICNNVTEPDISCIFKPGPGDEGYEWTFPGYSAGIDWGTPLTEPNIGTWPITPINYSGVHWIWPRNSDGYICEHAFFRQSIIIPDPCTVESSTIEITGDNEYIVYFNGVEIGSDGDCQEPYEGDIWMTSEVYAIDPVLFQLNEEKNVLAVHTYDNHLIAGLRFHLQIELSRSPVGNLDSELSSQSSTINIFPNPILDELTITWFQPESTFTKIEMYNSEGETVKTISYRLLPVGQHAYQLKTENLKPGIYFIRLQIGTNISNKKIVKN